MRPAFRGDSIPASLDEYIRAASIALRWRKRWMLTGAREDLWQAVMCAAGESLVRHLDASQTVRCAERWITATMRGLGLYHGDSSAARLRAGKSHPRRGFAPPPSRYGRIEFGRGLFESDAATNPSTLIAFVAGFVAARHGDAIGNAIHLLAEGGIARLPLEMRDTARQAVDIYMQTKGGSPS